MSGERRIELVGVSSPVGRGQLERFTRAAVGEGLSKRAACCNPLTYPLSEGEEPRFANSRVAA